LKKHKIVIQHCLCLQIICEGVVFCIGERVVFCVVGESTLVPIKISNTS